MQFTPVQSRWMKWFESFTVQSHMLSLKLNSEVTDISVKSQMLTFIQFVSPITSCVESAFLLVKDVRTLMP